MTIKRWRNGGVILFGLFLFIPVVQAQTPFDCTQCAFQTLTTLSATEELTVTTGDAKGIILSNPENKVFDNMTTHCLFSTKVMAGQRTGLIYSKFLDPDGDFVILQTTFAPGETEGNFEFLQGTGKWKGIKGSGKFRGGIRNMHN
jgi:hypothetical protein